MLFAVLRMLAHNSGLHFKQLLWVVREERGEQFGRRHYHALIAGLPSHWKTQGHCNHVESLWRQMGGGHPRVSVYNPTLDGVDYILKRGEEMARTLATRHAGDYHEFTKFGGSCDLTLSESVCNHLIQRQLNGRWGRGVTGSQKRRLLGETGRPTTEQGGAEFLTLEGKHCGDNTVSLHLPNAG